MSGRRVYTPKWSMVVCVCCVLSVVSMPCWELFDEQSLDYKKEVRRVHCPYDCTICLTVAHVHAGVPRRCASDVH